MMIQICRFLGALSIWHIVAYFVFGCVSYKVIITQDLKPPNFRQRIEYADWVLECQNLDATFSEKIFFSDEAHLWLGGYVNKENGHILGLENPQVVVEKPLHREKLIVWCALWSGGVTLLLSIYFSYFASNSLEFVRPFNFILRIFSK